jgi:hypothetical protein
MKGDTLGKAMEKQDFLTIYPELAASDRLAGYLGTTLSIPEIQAQVKRTLLAYGDELDEESRRIYSQFLEVTNAPAGIEHRFTGEHCTRIYLSRAALGNLLERKPAELHGGIAFLRTETDMTCIVWGSSIDSDIAGWLAHQGIRMEHTWESKCCIG